MGCSCSKDMKEGDPARKKKYEVKEDHAKAKSKSSQQKEQSSNYEAPVKQQSIAIVKKPKYVRTEQDKQIQQLYLNPEKIAELSQTNEKEFILLIKKHKLVNLNRFRGYEAQPPIILASGRKVSTLQWNPFTFALVQGELQLYNFIQSEANFNMKKIFELEKEDLGNNLANSEDGEQEAIIEMLSMMIENNSPLLKQVFNDMSHLIKTSHVKRIIPIIMRQGEAQKHLDLFINSKTFISVFIQKVKCLSSQKYKGSFMFFFEKYFSKFSNDATIKKELAKAFCNPPFNLGFGSSLILDYRKSKQIYDNIDLLIGKCTDLKDFDVYRFGNIGDLDIQQMEKNVLQDVKAENQAGYLKFIQVLKGKVENREKIEKQIQEILIWVKEGDLAQAKKKISALDISRETICQIKGMQGENLKVQIKALNHFHEFIVAELNPLELSCVYGHAKILNYFTEEMGLKSSKEFQMSQKAGPGQIDRLNFVLGPIFTQNIPTFEAVLNLSHLWTYDDFLSILTLLKQTKWFEGFKVALDSRFSRENFANRNLADKFRFVRDILVFPFKIDVNDDSMSDASGIFDEDQPRNEAQLSSRKNVLNSDEKIQLRKIIKTRLCEEPYTGAFIFQEFAQRRDTYKDVAEQHIIQEAEDVEVGYLKKCVESISEMDMNDYIVETQGQVIDKLYTVMQSHQNGQAELSKYEIEIEYLIDKLSEHPAVKKVQMENNEQQNRDNQI